MDINEIRHSVITELDDLTLNQLNSVKTFIKFLKYQEEFSSNTTEIQRTSETPNKERDLRKEYPGLMSDSSMPTFTSPSDNAEI